jgi:DUF4097 and DUF4098 domain-containing protein YvlB
MKAGNRGLLVAALTVALAAPASAQVRWERSDEGWCDRSWGNDERDRYCEVLTATVASTGAISVDGGANGGVEVVAWDRSEVEVRAKVWANARSEERAQEIARAVEVTVSGGSIRADGPETGRRESWGVSYELRVPRDTDLDMDTRNGGITVEDVQGDIRFSAMNGGVHLTGVAGDVRGRTTNGGLHIELAGDRWAGAGLDATTTNGGVELTIPEGYSAELVTGTVNGGIDIDFPVTVSGRIGRQLRTTLGDGGPTIRAVTTNGGVRIRRRQ